MNIYLIVFHVMVGISQLFRIWVTSQNHKTNTTAEYYDPRSTLLFLLMLVLIEESGQVWESRAKIYLCPGQLAAPCTS